MIKVSRLLQRPATTDGDTFAAAWHRSASWITNRLRGATDVRSFTQNAPVGDKSPIANAPASTYDGVEEFHFDTLADAESFDWGAWDAASLAPIARDLSVVIVGTARIMWSRPATPKADAMKMITMPVRKADMTEAAFREYWMNHHSPLSLAGPGSKDRLAKVEFCPSDKVSLTGLAPAPFDGIGAIWFDAAADFEAEFATDYYRQTLAPDEPNFTDSSKSRGMVVREIATWERDA